MARVRQIDIARRVGVSQEAVAFALSPHERLQRKLNPETRKRILKAAAEMGHVVNHMARSLRTGRTGIVMGFLDQFPGSGPASKRIRAFAVALHKRGYSLLMQWLPEMSEERKLSVFEKCRSLADGLIFFSFGISEPANLERLRSLLRDAQPSIVPTGVLVGTEVDYARVNWGESFGLLGAHFKKSGHKHVGICGFQNDRRIKAVFEREMAKWKISVECFFEGQPVCSEASYRAGVDAARKWMDMKNRPTALYCGWDEMTLALMEVVRRHGFSLPEDLAMVGGGNADFYEWLQPPLTVLTHSEDELAELAVSDLVRRIEKGEQIPGTGRCVGVVKQKLIVGGS
ncbi:MAG: LacI family DNA-binding transcriptional regulator [Kiritimatiellae bacterium]|nr:LacI family DNA-binding transcriptional regulator [Kiritimatiellia bacterium]